MPLGIFRTLKGTLDWSGSCYILRDEDGRWWCIEMRGGPEHLVGCKVTVKGVRLGFHWVYVWRVLAVDGVTRKGGVVTRLAGAVWRALAS